MTEYTFENNGKAWTPADDELLKSLYCKDKKKLKELVQIFKRYPYGITSRLSKVLGLRNTEGKWLEFLDVMQEEEKTLTIERPTGPKISQFHKTSLGELVSIKTRSLSRLSTAAIIEI